MLCISVAVLMSSMDDIKQCIDKLKPMLLALTKTHYFDKNEPMIQLEYYDMVYCPA